VLAAGLALTIAVTGSVQPAWAAPQPSAARAAAAPSAAALVADPTELATDEDKVEAARVLGINPGIDMLVLNDQEYVLSLWRQAREGSYVKNDALRAYDTTDSAAAYAFIKTGIFAAAALDAQDEIAASRAKALRRSVAVTVGLDPAETALIELGDRDFIFAVWQRVKAGSHVQSAAQAAIATGTGQEDWTAFLTTGAQAAREQDIEDEIAGKTEEEAARLRAEQLVGAKRSLLQLLLLPSSAELESAPNRQYVLHIKNSAKGTEVQLAAQAAINAPDAELEKALSDFIFTGGAAANRKDEDVAAAKELAGYKTQVTAIRDAAKLDGLQANLVAAATKALTTGTLLALQTFLLKGQDEARVLDRKAHATVVLAGDRIGVLAADGVFYLKEGALNSAGWVRQYGGVKQVVVSGTRVGVLTYDGVAYVKDGAVASTGWVKQYAAVKQLVLAGTRVGVLTNDGIAYVKEGALTAGWTKEYTGARQLVLAGTRIGVVTTSGTPLVKEGALSAAWDQQNFGTPVKSLALDGTRVGIISDYGTAWVKEGAISTVNWVKQMDGASSLNLSGTRVGFVERPNISVPEVTIPENAPGRPWVKDGTLASTSFVNVRTGANDAIRLVLAGDRVAVLVGAGTVYVKDGTVSAAWVAVRTIGGLG
jgi:hypothetical protein